MEVKNSLDTELLLSKEQLLDVLTKDIDRLRTKYKVNFLGLFGSYSRGEQNASSDVDVLVDFEESPNFFEFMDIAEELEELIRKPVDLVSKNSLRGNRGKIILEEVIEIWPQKEIT